MLNLTNKTKGILNITPPRLSHQLFGQLFILLNLIVVFIVFSPNTLKAQLSNPPPCPQYHWMLADGYLPGCSFQQFTEVQMDFPISPPSELLTKNIIVKVGITPASTPIPPLDFIDEAKTMASLNSVFNSWTPSWTINQTTASVRLTLSIATAVPVQSFYSTTTPIFTIYMNGLPNTVYTYSFDPLSTAIILEIAGTPPTQLACQGTSQNGLIVSVPDYDAILLAGTVEFMNNDLADGICSANGGFPNLLIDLYKVLDPTQPLDQDVTNTSGRYGFDFVVSDCEYKIEPIIGHDDDWRGVSTRDLVQIQNHLLGIDPFTKVWEYMAADADLSGFVTAADIAILQDLILGSISELLKGWRFMDKIVYNTIPFPPIPILFKDYIQDNYPTTTLDIDFAGVKVGDLDGSTNICDISLTEDNGSSTRDKKSITTLHDNLVGLTYTSESLAFITCEKIKNSGDQICHVFVEESGHRGGMISLEFEGDYSIKDIYSSTINSPYSFASYVKNPTKNVRFLWTENVKSSDPIATIRLSSLKSVNNVLNWKVDDSFGNYTFKKASHSKIKLNKSKKSDLQIVFTPNPVNRVLNLSIASLKSSQGTILIYDISGKIIIEKNIQLQKGITKHVVQDIDNYSKGTSILQLVTNSGSIAETFIKL